MMDDGGEGYGLGGGGGGSDISFGDYWDTHVPDYEVQVNYDGSMAIGDSTRNSAAWLAAAAGWGAGAVVGSACVLVPSALSGPAAPEVAALLVRPCAVLGGAAAGATGIWVGNLMQARMKLLEK